MKHLSFLLFLFISVNLFAQTPGAFSYQAVVRNASGDIVANQEVTFQISILQDSEAGSAVFTERHYTTTNDYGLANLQIGNGTLVSGSFSPDGWGEAPHFIKVEFDPDGGSSFTELSTTQLLAVPYAFHAQTVENDKVNDADADPTNELQTLSLSGNDLAISDGNSVTLPESGTSLWLEDGDDIYFNAGKVGIGAVPGSDLKKFQVVGEQEIGIVAENEDDRYGALFARNFGTGPAADFRNHVRILDGTQGAGKVLTSDADGYTSWQTPSSGSSLWSENGSEIYVENNVGIGTSDPEQDLDIINPTSSVRIKSTTSGTILNPSGDAFLMLDKASASNNANLNLQSNGTTQFYAGLLGNNNFSISTNLFSLNGLEVQQDGDVAASGDVNVSGDIHVNGEVHTGITGDARMTPVAYGTVVSGNLTASSGNVTLQVEGYGMYDIIVGGASFKPFNFSASLTLIGTKPGFINADAQADRNKVVVYTREEDGSPEPFDFMFVIYQP